MKQEATNTFGEGMIMDLNPLTTPNNVLTSALNATMITYNGNEFVLQNDMGNGRVETAYLPSGYVPVGIKEYGGIIYVASYNPLTNKGQIGSFPSPERNISSEEISPASITLSNSDFKWDGVTAQTFYVQKDLYKTRLSPGDKFIIYAGADEILNNKDKLYNCFKGDIKNKVVKLSFATITDNGEIVVLDKLKDYDIGGGTYIIPELTKDTSGKPNIESYRSLVSSPYNVFNSKVSGKLLLIAELITIDSFGVAFNYLFEGEETALVKDVKIIANMSYDSEDGVYLYGVSGSVKDGNVSNDISVLWDGENRNMSSLFYTVKDYDYKNRPERDIEWRLTPCMSYGPIKYLSKAGILQLDKVGTGFINLSEWRYYIDNNSIQLSWALQTYPEPNHIIKGVRFIMSCYNRQNIIETIVYNVSTKNTYNGAFTEVVPFESEFYKIENQRKLLKNRLYYVTVEVQYAEEGSDDTSKYKYFHRWLYTSNQFNKHYIEGVIYDFIKLQPDINLITTSEYSFSKLGEPEVSEVYGRTIVDAEGNNAPTSVPDIDSLSAQQIFTRLSLEGSVNPFIEKTYDIFDLDTTSVDISVKINNDSKSISFGEHPVSYTGVDSAYMDEYLALKVMNDWNGNKPSLPSTNDTDKLVEDPYNIGCLIKDELNTTYKGNNAKFSGIEVDLLEHIKSFGHMEKRVITYNGTLHPLAYNKESFSSYDLQYNTGGYFTATSVCAYGQCEAGGHNGYDRFNDITSGGFGKEYQGDKGNGLSSDVLSSNNQNAMRNAWKSQTGPIASVVWTYNGKDKSSSLKPIDRGYSNDWAWNPGDRYCSNSGYKHLLEDNMAIHIFMKRTDGKFGLINMTARVGSNRTVKDLAFTGTRSSTYGFRNIYTCIAGMLVQLYMYESMANTGSKFIPTSVYYISRYTTNFSVDIKTEVNYSEATRITLQSDLESKLAINSLMRVSLFSANKGVTLNDNDIQELNNSNGLDITDNNITWNLSTTSTINSAVYQTINSGIGLRDKLLSDGKTTYGVYIIGADGSIGSSDRTLNQSTVYYLKDNMTPSVVDSKFKLKQINKWKVKGEQYCAELSETVVSPNDTSFANKFVIQEGELRINEKYVIPKVTCHRTQGGKGDDGSVGQWADFSPFKFLKCWN